MTAPPALVARTTLVAEAPWRAVLRRGLQAVAGGLDLARVGSRHARSRGRLSHHGVSLRRRIERFGFRGVARMNHKERGRNWGDGGVRLRRPRCGKRHSACLTTVMSMGPGR